LLGTISHELRTPLTLVFGQAQRLKRQAQALQAPEMEGMANHILSGSRQLTRLVDDLLDFTRLERGEVELRPQDFDLVPLLDDLLQSLHEDLAERLVWDLSPALWVHADQARVTQIVTNLVQNARKYASEGRILVRATPAAGNAVRIEVTDEGPGIPEEEQQRIWEKLYRGQKRGGPSAGSGIGLAVVKTLVEAQGGHVGLESKPGQGARFWFELPAAQVSGAVA
jgi:two-component system sensor histidine kinase KdpD